MPPRAEKRKSKDEPASPTNVDNDCSNTAMVNASGIPISVTGVGLVTQPQNFINPVTGLNVQISAKKCKTSSPCAISPVLLECPEQDCNKKYKHANGLRYHQSHAHGSVSLLDDDSVADIDESHITPLPSPVSLVPVLNEAEAMENILITSQQPILKVVDSTKECTQTDTEAASSPLNPVEHSTVGEPDITPSTSCLDLLQSVSTHGKILSDSNTCSKAAKEEPENDIAENNKIHLNTVPSLECTNVNNNNQTSSGKFITKLNFL